MSTVIPFRPAATPPPCTIELTLRPISTSPGRYSASRTDDGRVVVRSSRQPLLDGASALAAEGMPDDVILQTRHAGSPHIAQRGRIGELAKWTIVEGDRSGLQRRPWQAFPTAASANGPAAPAREPKDSRQGIACIEIAREARRAPRLLRSTATALSRRIAA